MTTVVVVRKGGNVAIAADSLVTFGDTRLAYGYAAHDKLFRIGDSTIGMAGDSAHDLVLRRALAALPAAERRLHSREDYFLKTEEEDDDPYESSQVTALIANPAGIFGVYSYREVFEYERFWAIGTGREFAIGAMFASWDRLKTAREIAELGVRAGCEFDTHSAGPMRAHTHKLKG